MGALRNGPDRMDRTTYQEMLKALEEIDSWLCDQGFTKLDRIRRHKRNLAVLVEALENRTLDLFQTEANAERRRELMWSLVDSMEFTDSIAYLRAMACEIPHEVLRRALDGPTDLTFEDHNSNHARNAMFEIVIAGRLAKRGLVPRLGGEPDVVSRLEDRNILIQCKRVFSDRSLEDNLRAAGKQLKRDLTRSSDPRDCGIVAISISRIFNEGDKLLVVSNEAALRQKLEEEVDVIRSRCTGCYRNINDPRIAGVLYHLSTPAYLKEIGLYMAAHSVTIHPIPYKADRALLKKLEGYI